MKQRENGNIRLKNDVARYPAFLDDYAYLIQALIALNESTGKRIYLDRAVQLVQEVIENFSDSETPMFFYTAHTPNDAGYLVAISLTDNAISADLFLNVLAPVRIPSL